jgi:4'-phosphopantetheinyl transferase
VTLGFPVQWWPAQLAPARHGVIVIGAAGATSRAAARAGIRAALRQAIAQLADVAEGDVTILSEPGRAPAVSIRGARPLPALGIAISHDADLSLAAINLHGPVGIDLLQVRDTPDWRTVAHDYLGPEMASVLAGITPAVRPGAFAQLWTDREARLKCHGLPLVEWTLQGHAQIAGCRCMPLALPVGFAGSVAFR